MLCFALVLYTVAAPATDDLDALLALPPPDVAVPLEVRPGEAGEPRSLRGSLGALMLMTAEGNFPVPVLNTGEVETAAGRDVIWLTDELLRAGDDFLYPSVVTTAEVEWFPTHRLALRTFLTTGEVRAGSTLEPPSENRITVFGRSPSEFFESGFWLAEFSLTGFFGPLTVEAGRRFTDIAGGLIYQDVGTGLFVTLSGLDSGFVFNASVYAAGRDFDSLTTPSPIAHAALRYEWEWINSVELFAASYRSRNGDLTDVFVSTLAEAAIVAQPDLDEDARRRLIDAVLTPLLAEDIGDGAQLNYFGASVQGQFGRLQLRSRLAISRGAFETVEDLDAPLESIEALRVSLRGYAFDVDTSVTATASLSFGAEAFGFSGFKPGSVRDRQYNSFIAIAPLWTYSTIFFTSGVNQTFTAARGSAAGINGHGVFGFGPTVDWTPRDWAIEAKILALFADEPIDPLIGGGGDFYGIESNAMIRAELGDGLALQGIAGVLVPGSFFPDDALAYRALVILDGRLEL
ncbi:MAG: hypothetical protein AAF654_14885 [Myxococcota bacterium]